MKNKIEVIGYGGNDLQFLHLIDIKRNLDIEINWGGKSVAIIVWKEKKSLLNLSLKGGEYEKNR